MPPRIVKRVNPQRFDVYLGYTNRVPLARMIHTEVEHYSDLNERVLGVICLDHTDRDFAVVILARDEIGRFRAFCTKTDFETLKDGREWLFGQLRLHVMRGTREVPQFEPGKKLDLFSPVVPTEKQAPDFKTVRTAANYYPARRVISEMMPFFQDVDGNFLEQFQTTGFDARIWELYLFCMLSECGIKPDRSISRPDFVVRGFPFDFSMEATIVARKSEDVRPIVLDSGLRQTPQVPNDPTKHDRMAIRFGSSLRSKLCKRYWELPTVAGRPFIIAIADFHADFSMTWSHTSLIRYLFGFDHVPQFDEGGKLIVLPVRIKDHEWRSKKIPSGFFNQPGTENISAILSSSSGTISKFTRMGMQASFLPSEKLRVFRAGVCHDHDPNATVPRPFDYEVNHERDEDFCEGVSLFHNPKAAFPIDPQLMPWFAHHQLMNDGNVVSTLPEFFPYWSITHNIIGGKKSVL